MRAVIAADGYGLLKLWTDTFEYEVQPVLAFAIDPEDEAPWPEPITLTGDALVSDPEQHLVAALVLPDARIAHCGSLFRNTKNFLDAMKDVHAQRAKHSAVDLV